MDETPVMIFPDKTDAPALDVIVTLCGIAASAFENAILKTMSAGALRVAGENAKSFASRARIRGAAVGLGVGRGVGCGVGVGFGVGFGVGDLAGVGVSDGAAVGVAIGSWLAVGSTCGAAEGAGLAGMSVDDGDGTTDAVGTEAELGTVSTGDANVADLGVEAPQAATSRPTAISRDSLGDGTAAL